MYVSNNSKEESCVILICYRVCSYSRLALATLHFRWKINSRFSNLRLRGPKGFAAFELSGSLHPLYPLAPGPSILWG